MKKMAIVLGIISILCLYAAFGIVSVAAGSGSPGSRLSNIADNAQVPTPTPTPTVELGTIEYRDLGVEVTTIISQAILYTEAFVTGAGDMAAYVDLLEQYPDAIVIVGNDVAYKYETHVGSQCVIDSLISLLDDLYAQGLVDDQAVYESLREKLVAAQQKLAQEGYGGAIADLQAFMDEVEVQSGIHIDPEAAEQLLIIADCIEVRTSKLVLEPTPDVGDYAVLGLNSVWLRQGSDLYSGHVGAQNASPGPVLDSGAEVTIGRNVTFHDLASTIAGDTVKLKLGADVFDLAIPKSRESQHPLIDNCCLAKPMPGERRQRQTGAVLRGLLPFLCAGQADE